MFFLTKVLPKPSKNSFFTVVTLDEDMIAVGLFTPSPSIQIWDFAGLEPHLMHTLTFDAGHREAIISLAVSPDKTFLVSGARDGQMRMWNIANIKTTAPTMIGYIYSTWWRSNAHHASILTLAYSADGQKLVSGAADGEVKLWNVATPTSPRLIRSLLRVPNHSINCLVFCPDMPNQLLITSKNNHEYRPQSTTRLLSVDAPRVILWQKTVEGSCKIALNPVGNRLFVVNSGLDTSSLEILQSVNQAGFSTIQATHIFGNYHMTGCSFSPDASKMVVAHENSDFFIYETDAIMRGNLAGIDLEHYKTKVGADTAYPSIAWTSSGESFYICPGPATGWICCWELAPPPK
jgi:WD40 repeat protein